MSSVGLAEQFAALYSHTNRLDRHRGSALLVGLHRVRFGGRELGTIPKTMPITVKCRDRSFVVVIEGCDNFLGEMSWLEAYVILRRVTTTAIPTGIVGYSVA